MKFQDFERAARLAYDEIPDAFKEGIDGVVVSRDAIPHPEHPDVYTMGECVTEEHMSDYGGPDTTRSVIALYWGSFRALSRQNSDFDWDGELWETLTHELRHHLESLAGDEALEGIDYATDQTFKRDEGGDFDPWYFEYGEHLGEGQYKVESSHYLEQMWTEAEFSAAGDITFDWNGAQYTIVKPEALGDVHFVWIEGIEVGAGSLELVLVRKRTWWEDAKKLFSTSRPIILESKASARLVTS